MKLSDYPPEQLQEWFDLPATKGFLEELDYLSDAVRRDYRKGTNFADYSVNKGKEQGIEEVKVMLENLKEGL
jgi:hypothetical protein